MTVANLMSYVGPKAEAFAWDKRMITGIMGPVGSAKTTSCIRKSIHAALWQKPGPDGVYRAKGAVVRDTYPQLRKTALASWWQWFPKKVGQWNGDAPFEHTVRFKIFDAGGVTGRRQMVTVELTMIFAAIGEHKVEDVMRGWELTFLWLNEGDLVARDCLTIGIGRVGRYPAANQGGCHWRGIFIDMNAPDVDNWTYELLVDKDLGLDAETEAELRAVLGEQFGIGFYVQPGGRSKDPPPENIHNLPAGYYAQQVMAMSKNQHMLRRMVDNEFGPVRKGQPVHPEYNDAIHCRDDLQPLKGEQIRLGVDAGLTPACLFGQISSLGQTIIFDECVTFAEEGDEIGQIGGYAFGLRVGRQFMANWGDHFDLADVHWCDPAATAGESAEGADPSWRLNFQRGLREATGRPDLKVRPSSVPGNALDKRLEAVRAPMLKLVEGGEPAFLISSRCKIYRRGLKGAYIYKRTEMKQGAGRLEYKPVKDDFSHTQDAGQYLCWGLTRHGNGDGRRAAHPGSGRDGARRLPKIERTSNVHRRGRAVA